MRRTTRVKPVSAIRIIGVVRTAFPVSGGPQRAMLDSRVPAVSGAPAFIENRRDPRFTLMFRAVKLIAGDGEYMGILRDASASGVRLQLFHPVPPVQHFVLEMANGDHHRMALVWERDGYAGFHFDERIDVSRLISDTGPYPKRAVRLGVDLAVQVSGRGLAPVQAMIRNLSQQPRQQQYIDRKRSHAQAGKVLHRPFQRDEQGSRH